MFSRLAAVCLIACLLVVGGCSGDATSGKRKVVVVDSFMLQDICQDLIGSDAEILFPVPVGTAPEDWTPTADDIAQIQKADLILLNGGNVSEWAEKVSLPAAKVVKTWEGYKDQLIEISVGVPHRHGDGPEHQHTGVVGYTWFDDQLALKQLEAVKDAVLKILPGSKSSIEESFTETHNKLVNFYTGVDAAVFTVKKLKFVGSHPVYHYFARKHGMDFEYVHWEPSVMPTDVQLAELKALDPDVFIWESKPLEAADKAVQDLDIATFVIRPLSGGVEQSYWQKEMLANREEFKNIHKLFKNHRKAKVRGESAVKESEPAKEEETAKDENAQESTKDQESSEDDGQ